MQGIIESLVMDSLPVEGCPHLTIPANVMRPRPIKRRGRPSQNVGTACLRTNAQASRALSVTGTDYSYVRKAKMLEDRAVKRMQEAYKGQRAYVCRALGDLVGVFVVRREGYVIWRAYSPVSGTFGDMSVVPKRSHGLSENDVRHLAGYSELDRISVRPL